MQAIHGRSCLDVWWMRPGIRHGAFTPRALKNGTTPGDTVAEPRES